MQGIQRSQVLWSLDPGAAQGDVPSPGHRPCRFELHPFNCQKAKCLCSSMFASNHEHVALICHQNKGYQVTSDFSGNPPMPPAIWSPPPCVEDVPVWKRAWPSQIACKSMGAPNNDEIKSGAYYVARSLTLLLLYVVICTIMYTRKITDHIVTSFLWKLQLM